MASRSDSGDGRPGSGRTERGGRTASRDSKARKADRRSSASKGDRGARARGEKGRTGHADSKRRSENKELERRQSEAEREWRSNPKARREFARDVGHEEHQRFADRKRSEERKRGRKEGRDFGVEHTEKHPDGGKVRYDYVDKRQHKIVDRKPAREGEKVSDLAKEHKKQRDRHREAYKAKHGKEPTYEYSVYPSTQDLYEDGKDKKTK